MFCDIKHLEEHYCLDLTSVTFVDATGEGGHPQTKNIHTMIEGTSYSVLRRPARGDVVELTQKESDFPQAVVSAVNAAGNFHEQDFDHLSFQWQYEGNDYVLLVTGTDSGDTWIAREDNF